MLICVTMMKRLLFFLGLISHSSGQINRYYDPIELTGNDLFELIGAVPASIVGFRYDGNNDWHQIPIQIDEMHHQA